MTASTSRQSRSALRRGYQETLFWYRIKSTIIPGNNALPHRPIRFRHREEQYTGQRINKEDGVAEGDLLSSYQIDQVFRGEGNVRSYRATAPDGTSVCIKVVEAGDAEARAAVERLGALVSLEHPNVARVLDRGLVEGGYAVVREWVDGNASGHETPAVRRYDVDRRRLRSRCRGGSGRRPQPRHRPR